LILGTILLVYGSFIEPRFLTIKRHTIDIENIEEPIRIVFMADFQVGPYRKIKFMEDIVNRTLLLEPDLVVISGDQVDNGGTSEDESIYLSPLRGLAAQIPTYAIHGNHEYGIGGGKSILDHNYRLANVTKQSKKRTEELGVRYLVNEMEKITINDQSFYLFGGDSYWAGKLDYSVLDQRTKNIPTIALIHNPSFQFNQYSVNDYPEDIDLFLSGHTHGGQIRLPFLGPIGTVDDILPHNQYQGLHQLGSSKLLITSGAGETGTRARLFNPPEIMLIELR